MLTEFYTTKLASMAYSFCTLPSSLLLWYFEQLNVQVYERFFKVILAEIPNKKTKWIDYWCFVGKKPLEDDVYLIVAHNTFISIILFSSAITLFWHILKRSRMRFYLRDEIIINPKKIMISYLFLFLPLKNIDCSLTTAFSCLPFFENDLFLFLLITSIFYTFKYVVKNIKDRSQTFDNAYKVAVNVLVSLKLTVVIYSIFSVAFNVIALLPDHPALIIMSILSTMAMFAAELYGKRTSTFSIIHCLKNADKYIFLFVFLNISMIFSVVSVAYLTGWALFFEPIYSSFCLLANLILKNVFSFELQFSAVFCKIVLVYLFFNFISFISQRKGMI